MNHNVEDQSTEGIFPLQGCGNTLQEKRSFRQALFPTCTDTKDNLLNANPQNMVAQHKGEYLSLTVDEILVRNSITQLQHSLIRKLTLVKGDSPYSIESLTMKLGHVWGIVGPWKLVPMGKGFFNIQLSKVEDRDKILDRRTWSPKPGTMRIQLWVRGINPYKVNTTLAQVWVRFYELPMEFFQPKILHALASGLGTVIKIDERTRTNSMCHYA